MIVNATGGWSGVGVLGLASGGTGSLMDSLPDPMKLQLPAIAFVVVLITLLFLFLKMHLFKPITTVMDNREEAIRAGSETKHQAASMIEARQAEYAARLKELRGQAFEHRKALAAAVTAEKQDILDRAREASAQQRAAALDALKTERKAAEVELRAQIDALSESMAQHLLKQA